MWRTTFLLAILVPAVMGEAALTGGPYTINPIDVNGGSDHSFGGVYTVHATTGQSGGVGVVSGGVYELADGYWFMTPEGCDISEFGYILPDLYAVGASTQFFKDNRATGATYQNMMAAYGQPWLPNTGQTPDISSACPPACRLRAFAGLRASCQDAQGHLAEAFQELFSFEMLLGNEAFSDGMDSTIGLNGVNVADLGDLYAFLGVSGINSPLDEELALLRGRDLCPGGSCDPNDWLNDTIYYPQFTEVSDNMGNPCGGSCNTVRAAIYNRLPPNAENGGNSVAYISNYGNGATAFNDNFDAASQYPQGHGDAYGYYLKATKVYLDAFRGDPSDTGAQESMFAQDFINSQSADQEEVDPDDQVGGDEIMVPYHGVRNMAAAMAARSRAAIRVVDLTFRRDYREDPEDPFIDEVLDDNDTDRAWGTADWARRAGTGAYLDWAMANQLLPAPASVQADYPIADVHRQSVNEISELASSVSEMQERVDAAGAGLNPLGLVQNVVPFGIDASQLGSGSGDSHYEQVRGAALNALGNTRDMLGWANAASQRIREQGEAETTFATQVLDREADFNGRLIEIFGYPSPDDIADNDLDGGANDATEHQTSPDLVNYFLNDEQILANGWGPRIAPGQIQIALSEAKIAELRGDQADLALGSLEAEIDDLLRFIEFRTQTARQEIQIINLATESDIALTERLKQLKTSCNWWCKAKKVVKTVVAVGKAVVSCYTTGASAKCFKDGANAVGSIVSLVNSGQAYKALKSEFDIQKERARIQGWKDAELTGIRNAVEIEREKLRLESLIRQTPQLMVNIAIAGENMSQAIGRLNAAVQRGQRLLDDRERIRKLQRDSLEQYRWKDLAFRVFRNNSLQKYGAFFDLAGRYVMLAGRAYAYEYNDRTFADAILEDIHRERRLGNDAGTSGGLRGIITDFDNLATVNNFNSPFTPVGGRDFSLRTHMLGLGNGFGTFSQKNFTADPGIDECSSLGHGFKTEDTVFVSSSNSLPGGLAAQTIYYLRRVDPDTFTLHPTENDAGADTNTINITDAGIGTHTVFYAPPNRVFRSWVESRIVQNLDNLPVMQDYATLDPGKHFGPAIVIPISTEIADSNFFGEGPEAPFFADNFSSSFNIKVRNFAVVADGDNFSGIIGPTGFFFCFFMPVGDSILRVHDNGPFLNEPRPWAAVDQFLPAPPLVSSLNPSVQDRDYNPWVETAHSGGNYLNAVKRFREVEARISTLGQSPQFSTSVAGRSAWNTEWILVIPGGQWTGSNPVDIRNALMKFIYGPNGNPSENIGLTDIRLMFDAYAN